jgi:hypothetical protein
VRERCFILTILPNATIAVSIIVRELISFVLLNNYIVGGR